MIVATQTLKQALRTAGLTAEEFAAIIEVDPKTVGRWLTGQSTPYPRHRAKIARALNTQEHELWPEATPQPSNGGASGSRTSVGLGPEAVDIWAYQDNETAPTLRDLIANTDGPIDLIENERGILLGRDLINQLTGCADHGRQIRLLTTLPYPGRLKRLVEHAQIEVRVLDTTPDYGMVATVDTVLFMLNLGLDGYDPPILLKARRDNRTVFGRFTANFQTLWDNTSETITNAQQLATYLTNADQDDPEQDEPAGDGLAPAPEVTQVGAEVKPDERRRWPGRTDQPAPRK